MLCAALQCDLKCFRPTKMLRSWRTTWADTPHSSLHALQHFMSSRLPAVASQIPPGQTYKSPGEAYVEGDASSASYFLAGATITGGTVTVEGCGSDSLQGDVRFAEVCAWACTRARGSHSTQCHDDWLALKAVH